MYVCMYVCMFAYTCVCANNLQLKRILLAFINKFDSIPL